jgi:hypothetical protein
MNKNTARNKRVNRKEVRTGTRDVISQNPRRNMEMRVLRNTDGSAAYSATVHVPIVKERDVRHKNHGYLLKDEYENNQYQPFTKQGVVARPTIG